MNQAQIFGVLFALFQAVFVLYMNGLKNDMHEMKRDIRGMLNALSEHLTDHAQGRFQK